MIWSPTDIYTELIVGSVRCVEVPGLRAVHRLRRVFLSENFQLLMFINAKKLDLRVNEHTELEIFAEENPPKRVNRPEACGLRHLAFCVDNVEQTVKELTEVGIECEPIRVDGYTGKKMTFFHDPDGLPLELHE